jgi:hypothetical protein
MPALLGVGWPDGGREPERLRTPGWLWRIGMPQDDALRPYRTNFARLGACNKSVPIFVQQADYEYITFEKIIVACRRPAVAGRMRGLSATAFRQRGTSATSRSRARRARPGGDLGMDSRGLGMAGWMGLGRRPLDDAPLCGRGVGARRLALASSSPGVGRRPLALNVPG